jgi:hypothetical protein
MLVFFWKAAPTVLDISVFFERLHQPFLILVFFWKAALPVLDISALFWKAALPVLDISALFWKAALPVLDISALFWKAALPVLDTTSAWTNYGKRLIAAATEVPVLSKGRDRNTD